MGDPPNNRPAPTASGTLAKTPLIHLLLYALDKKLTGTIELFAPDKRTAVVVFSSGEPLKVRTSEPVAYLGQVLQQLGYVGDEELSRSLAELAKRKTRGPALHGALLLESHAIDRAKLQAGLAEQVARKLHHIAGMPADSAYAYYDGLDALRAWGGDDGAPVGPLPHLWSMLREYTPWDPVNAALTRIAQSPLRLARTADVARLRLAAEEVAAAEMLRAKSMRASDLAKAAGLNERTAQLLVYLLLVTKQVEVLNVPDVASASVRPSSPSSPVSFRPATMSQPPVPPKSGFPPPPPGLAPELTERWKEITDRAANIDRADYFMMLDVARDATRDDIESAFLTLAKRWHPDRLPPELAPVREACSRVFARMSEARSTLNDEEQRTRYMRLLSEGSGSPEAQDAVAKVIEAAQNFQKAEVYFKRNDLTQAESHCRLALEADATQPDYLAMLAWLVAQKAENQSPEKTAESIKMLDKAASMGAGRCEKAFYWRGLLYKRLGKIDLATKDFKRAVDLNPRNIDAAREVRLHQMRGSRGSTPPPPRAAPGAPQRPDETQKGGLFGRLFKKP